MWGQWSTEERRWVAALVGVLRGRMMSDLVVEGREALLRISAVGMWALQACRCCVVDMW